MFGLKKELSNASTHSIPDEVVVKKMDEDNDDLKAGSIFKKWKMSEANKNGDSPNSIQFC